MTIQTPTDALRLVPTRDDGFRVGRAILEAHSQWEKEHGVTGSQSPWQEQHIILLGQAAILSAPASPLPEGGGRRIKSELDFIGDITANIARDLDELNAGFSRSQRTAKTERAMAKMRERAAVLIQCAKDALDALPAAPTGDA